MGDALQCPRLLTVYEYIHDEGTTYKVDFLCSSVSMNPPHHVVASVTLEKQVAPPLIKKIRKRNISGNTLVVLVTDVNDTDLFPSVVRLKSLIRHGNGDRIIVLVSNPSAGKTPLKHPQDTLYSKDSLDSWLRQKKSAVETYYMPTAAYDGLNSVSALIDRISADYPDYTVLITGTRVRVTRPFLQRCRVLARRGKQLYRPYPVRADLLTDSGSQTQVKHKVATDVIRPVCIQAADLVQPELHDDLLDAFPPQPKERTSKEEKKLKIVRAIDPDLHALL